MREQYSGVIAQKGELDALQELCPRDMMTCSIPTCTLGFLCAAASLYVNVLGLMHFFSSTSDGAWTIVMEQLNAGGGLPLRILNRSTYVVDHRGGRKPEA